MNRTIMIWAFEDAPKALRDLSEHGGDEDGIALLPPGYSLSRPDDPHLPDHFPYWLDRLWEHTHPQYKKLEDGSIVVIWAHA